MQKQLERNITSFDDLIAGYRAFKTTRFRDLQAVYEGLEVHGQEPKVMIVACADSRVDPSVIFQAAPGTLFVLRNVAALVPPYAPQGRPQAAGAALEFGVLNLKVEHILVLGHAQCGGIKAALEANETPSDSDFIGPWVDIAADVRAAEGENETERQTAAEQIGIKISLQNLLTYPWIRQRVDEQKLSLYGGRYGIAAGELELLNPTTGSFEVVS